MEDPSNSNQMMDNRNQMMDNRNQMMDRSFPNFDSGVKTPVYDGRGKNNYIDRSYEKQVNPIQNN